MKIIEIKTLAIPAIKVIRFARFMDARGYFTEPYRRSDFASQLPFMAGVTFTQINESYSTAKVVRGMHFQWNPFMGKLVRTVHGRMVDLFLDIRKGSPTFGKAAAYDIPSTPNADYAEWIWVPPGFAHGNYFTQESTIEYLCSGEYSPGCEAGISPISPDIDWSLCDPILKQEFDSILASDVKITDKDKNGFSLAAWTSDERSNNFLYANLGE
ncbi:MAG: dTDP-4-dehydrorhamnose 3,5-epimerase family protein [Comamonadaceae bacterium]|nr:dTDP-4-dehydrorhamnose 3,5-epimerase family protein [Comamonadaceae bacterium]